MDDEEGGFSAAAGKWDHEDFGADGEEVSPEEEAVMAAFLGPGLGFEQRTLADIILDKIRQKEQRDAGVPLLYGPVQPVCPL
jgi:hypothetical protein